jgi:hypothetical protein
MKCSICGKRIWFWQKKVGWKQFLQHKNCSDIIKNELKDFEAKDII